jgi:hypothetical protein
MTELVITRYLYHFQFCGADEPRQIKDLGRLSFRDSRSVSLVTLVNMETARASSSGASTLVNLKTEESSSTKTSTEPERRLHEYVHDIV